MTQHPPSGWYPDPSAVPGQLRWWDGQQWTPQTMPEAGMSGPGGPAGPGEQPGHGPLGGPQDQGGQPGYGPSGQPDFAAPTQPGYGPPGGPQDQGGPAGWGGDTWSGQPGFPGQPWGSGQPESPPRKGLGAGVIIAIVAALVIVIGGGAGGVYFLLSRGGDGGERPQAAGSRTPGGAQQSQPPAASLPVSYSDPTTGITMGLPQGWEQSAASMLPTYATATGTTMPYPCPYGDGGGQCFKGTVMTGATPESESADTAQKKAFFTNVVVGASGYGIPPEDVSSDSFEIGEEGELNVGGKSAYRMSVTMDIPGSDVSALLDTVVIDNNGQSVYVLFASDKVDGAPPAAVFDQIVTTISVK